MVHRGGQRVRAVAGMTLVETLIALIITGVVVASTLSAIQLVLGGAAHMESRTSSRNAVSLAMLRIRNELRLSATITELTSNSIQFTIPDANDDGFDDVVRYSWSGIDGDPLERSFNGGDAAVLLADCVRFAISADVAELAQEQVPAWSGETLVAVHDQYPAEYPQSTGIVGVRGDLWVAANFEPWASGATKCRLTRARVSLNRDSCADGERFIVTITDTDSGSGWPSDTTYETVSMPLCDLPTSQQFFEIPFPGQPEVPVGDGCALVLKTNSNREAKVGFGMLTGKEYDDDVYLYYSWNDGNSWNPHGFSNDYDVRFYVYGKYDNELADSGTLEDGTVINLTVGLSAQAGADEVSADSTVNCINRPPIAGLPVADIPIRMNY